MQSRDHKLVILRQLCKESEPITLSELLEKLEQEYPVRSVRRWLSELVKEGLVEKSGHTKGAKYVAVKRPVLAEGKGLGFDEIRVRYRQERRQIIRAVILNELVGDNLKEYVQSEAEKRVPEEVHKDFIGDVLEDLEYIDETSLVGLGITPAELAHWQKLCRS